MAKPKMKTTPPKRSGKRGIGPKEDAALEVVKPAQARLPEMDDPEIEELERLAESYAKIRDERQALTSEEVRLKNTLLAVMHSYKRTSYVHAGIEIKIVFEKEKVKVRVSREKDAAD